MIVSVDTGTHLMVVATETNRVTIADKRTGAGMSLSVAKIFECVSDRRSADRKSESEIIAINRQSTKERA